MHRYWALLLPGAIGGKHRLDRGTPVGGGDQRCRTFTDGADKRPHLGPVTVGEAVRPGAVRGDDGSDIAIAQFEDRLATHVADQQKTLRTQQFHTGVIAIVGGAGAVNGADSPTGEAQADHGIIIEILRGDPREAPLRLAVSA